jgi:hypothetical protein
MFSTFVLLHVIKYIVRYSENSKDSREKTREIHTPIEIRDITLSNGTYPRIGKIQSWLRKKFYVYTR